MAAAVLRDQQVFYELFDLGLEDFRSAFCTSFFDENDKWKIIVNYIEIW